MNILAFGDIIGKPGRQCLIDHLEELRAEHAPDFVLLNGENAAGGFGLTEKIYDLFVDKLQIDCVTMGNHWRDKPEIENRAHEQRLVLPANMGNVSQESWGAKVVQSTSGKSVAVINLLGRVFMHGENRDPFSTVDRLLTNLPETIKLRIVDIHAETTSEKQALGHHLDGRVSLVYGTHTHVPTADERILAGGTGYATDIGMTGGYDSVIGIRKESAIHRMLTGEKKRFEPSGKDPWMCYLVANLCETTGKCLSLERFRKQLT